MIYEKIQGWFNYEGFYDMMIERFDDATFVEIGAWKGKSACYMGERLKESGKNIHYFVVDNFKGSPNEAVHTGDKDVVNGTLYETFCRNIKPLKNYINVIKGDSQKVYKMFDDKSIDMLFIDGNHEAVKQDIELWLPKVKGIIAGHDYEWESVSSAVKEILPNHKVWNNSVWYVDL